MVGDCLLLLRFFPRFVGYILMISMVIVMNYTGGFSLFDRMKKKYLYLLLTLATLYLWQERDCRLQFT